MFKIDSRLIRIFDIVRSNSDINVNKFKFYHDRNVRSQQYEIGDYVKKINVTNSTGLTKKLLPKFVGPYEVLDRIGEVDYVIRLASKPRSRKTTVHVNRLRRCAYSAAKNQHASRIEDTSRNGDTSRNKDTSRNEDTSRLEDESDVSGVAFDLFNDDSFGSSELVSLGIDGAESELPVESASLVEQEEDDDADLGLEEQELEWDEMVEQGEDESGEIEAYDGDQSFMPSHYHQNIIDIQNAGARIRPQRNLRAPERLTYF